MSVGCAGSPQNVGRGGGACSWTMAGGSRGGGAARRERAGGSGTRAGGGGGRGKTPAGTAPGTQERREDKRGWRGDASHKGKDLTLERQICSGLLGLAEFAEATAMPALCPSCALAHLHTGDGPSPRPVPDVTPLPSPKALTAPQKARGGGRGARATLRRYARGRAAPGGRVCGATTATRACGMTTRSSYSRERSCAEGSRGQWMRKRLRRVVRCTEEAGRALPFRPSFAASSRPRPYQPPQHCRPTWLQRGPPRRSGTSSNGWHEQSRPICF